MGDFARNWAARQKTGSASAKAVLKAYAEVADYPGGDGVHAFPSIERLEELTELNRNTIFAAIKRLLAGGWIADTGRRVGMRGSIKVYALGPQRVPELGLLGDHAAAASSTENGTVQTVTSPAFGANESQNPDTHFLPELQEEAQADARDPEPVDNPATAERKRLGEGTGVDLPPADPAADPVAAVFMAWDDMEARHGLPGPLVPDVPRRLAVAAGLAEVGLIGCLAIIAAIEASTLIAGKRARRHRGQSDWEATFDHVFRVGRRYAASKLFDRLLAASAGLLDGGALEDFAALADRELAAPDFSPAAMETVR